MRHANEIYDHIEASKHIDQFYTMYWHWAVNGFLEDVPFKQNISFMQCLDMYLERFVHGDLYYSNMRSRIIAYVKQDLHSARLSVDDPFGDFRSLDQIPWQEREQMFRNRQLGKVYSPRDTVARKEMHKDPARLTWVMAHVPIAALESNPYPTDKMNPGRPEDYMWMDNPWARNKKTYSPDMFIYDDIGKSDFSDLEKRILIDSFPGIFNEKEK